MLHTTQEHKNTDNKITGGRMAAVIISFLLPDGDQVKTRGKTRSWMKRRKQRVYFQIRITHGGDCKLQRNTNNGLWHFLEFVGHMLYNMIKVCANAIKVYVSLKTLERPPNIIKRVQKCYKSFKGFITCYNGLYGNVIRCANRFNILFLTCCRTWYMACLKGLPRG